MEKAKGKTYYAYAKEPTNCIIHGISQIKSGFDMIPIQYNVASFHYEAASF